MPQRQRKPGATRTGGRGRARNLGILAVGLVGAWLVTAATVPTVLGKRSPELGASLGMTSADTLAAQSLAIVNGQPSQTSTARARDLARQALAREPVNTPALRALGLAAVIARDESRAEQFFRASEFLSRREPSAQLWLLENAVARGDIAGAITHHDRALRTSSRTSGLLLPVLANATEQPMVARALAAKMAERPPWWSAYFEKLVANAKAPGGLSTMTRALELDPADLGERQLLVAAMTKLAGLGAYDAARDLYGRASPTAANAGSMLRGGDFTDIGQLAPFDWSLAASTDLSISLEARNEASDDVALHLISEGSQRGEFARQLLMLAPGQYQLGAVVGNVSGSRLTRPAFELVCASNPPRPNEPVLARLAFPDAAASGQQAAIEFTAPPSCPAQWLVITANGGSAGFGRAVPWVDSVTVQRR